MPRPYTALFPPCPPYSSLAKWETAFSPQNTQERDFHVNGDTTVKVPMMNREDHYYYLVDRNLSCDVVGVPYEGNATALFILPSEGKMPQVEDGLTGRRLRKWLQMFTKRYSSDQAQGHPRPPGPRSGGGKDPPSCGTPSKPTPSGVRGQLEEPEQEAGFPGEEPEWGSPSPSPDPGELCRRRRAGKHRRLRGTAGNASSGGPGSV